MKVEQRDIVEVNFRLPEGIFKPHPVVVISSNAMHELEPAFIGVMASSKDYQDEFCFELKDYMVTHPPREKCIVKCHLISMFSEKDVLDRHGKVKKDFFIPLMRHILQTTFAIDRRNCKSKMRELRFRQHTPIRFISLLGLVLIGCGRFYAQGHAKFAKTRHDFAEIKEEKGLASTVFSFENTGTKPIKVLSVKATCGCTTPIWGRDSVMPGSSGFVKVEYNPLGRPGVFAKEILVETDGSPSHISLTIHGKVTPRPKGPEDFYPFEEGSIRMRTNHLTYGSVYEDDTITQSTILYNQGTKTIQFSKSGSKVPNHLKPQLSKMSLAPGDTLMLSVSYVAGSKKDWGFAFDNIYLSTNDADRPMKRINISADIAERFTAADKANAPNLSIAKMEIDMGTITDGEMPKAVFDVQNTGKNELIVRKLSAACTCIEAVSSGPLGPGERGTITLTFNSRGRIGEFEKDAILITNDPNQAVTTLQIKGKVVRTAGGGGEAGGRDE